MKTAGGTVTASLGLQHGAGAAPAAQLVVLFDRHDLTREGSCHVLRGLDAVELVRDAASTPTRLRRGEQRLLTLPLSDDRVSSQHARLERTGEGWTAVDSGSRNGTHLNRERLTTTPTLLEDGDVLEVGRTFVLFRQAVPVPSGVPADRAEDELQPSLRGFPTFHHPLARSYREVAKAATTELSLLIQGATGTGKEHVASGLHALSGRAGPFVAVNCATLTAELADSALFGHQRGAFTGAAAARTGLVRQAHGGTLFLDEVAELPAPVQAKLLRTVETREVVTVGADRPTPVDFRLVAASHVDLASAQGFRPDLYARLSQLTVLLPALNQRREDLGMLLRAILRGRVTRLDREAAWALALHSWPHNVRELVNCLDRGCALAEGDELSVADLKLAAPAPVVEKAEQSEADGRRAELEQALRDSGGNVTEVARRMGESRNTTHRWLRRLGIDPARFRTK